MEIDRLYEVMIIQAAISHAAMKGKQEVDATDIKEVLQNIKGLLINPSFQNYIEELKSLKENR